MADKKWIQKAVPKSHRGLFTAKAKAHGMGVQEYANYVKTHGGSTKLKREAALARRFAKGI